MQARQETIEALRNFLLSIFPMIEAAEGFKSVQLFQSHTDPAKFLIVEIWDGIESHKAAATLIPPEKLEEIRTMLASAPKGDYFNQVQNQ